MRICEMLFWDPDLQTDQKHTDVLIHIFFRSQLQNFVGRFLSRELFSIEGSPWFNFIAILCYLQMHRCQLIRFLAELVSHNLCHKSLNYLCTQSWTWYLRFDSFVLNSFSVQKMLASMQMQHAYSKLDQFLSNPVIIRTGDP